MDMTERSVIGQPANPQALLAGVRMSARLIAAPVSALGRALAGPSGCPREHRREGSPEHELHQIAAARKDRFDGLL